MAHSHALEFGDRRRRHGCKLADEPAGVERDNRTPRASYPGATPTLPRRHSGTSIGRDCRRLRARLACSESGGPFLQVRIPAGPNL